ncbi:glutathione S-transferase family protein [Exilibacterium tricleocarpae]|uniref:Glutathione S-transferase family protein n=1 Tax=Exilibacterium tricleocarpae TaxID=2591008 RepID=A0A545SPT2_9GAMM|nr:glutathione S-transferase family protein [Exilibacterium tricleocarpae]TQV66989.1 glutathione S-transferase family protein [Exilibacterium tricleocarpae]
MTTLYEWPPTRSQRARWVLEELGLDYESHPVNLMEGDQHADTYRAIHPLGVVPALATDSYTLLESAAIVLQLIDENPQTNLAPAVGSAARAIYYQWCIFACAELDPCLMMYFDNTLRPLEAMRPPGTAHDPGIAARGRADFASRAEMLSKVLDGRDYLVGGSFSGADIMVGHSCFMATHMELIGDYPVLEGYYRRLAQRPGHRKAYG